MDIPRSTSSTHDAKLRTLIAAALRGDEPALEALIERMQPRVYALARAIVRRPDWAEDVTQDALMRMVQKLPEFAHSADVFDTWLLCIARNTGLSLLRKHRVREEYAPRDEETQATALPSDALIAQEDLGRIAAALDRLPPDLREIIVLRFFHHLECGEIGRIVGQRAGTVRSRIFRAVHAIRAVLTEEDPS